MTSKHLSLFRWLRTTSRYSNPWQHQDDQTIHSWLPPKPSSMVTIHDLSFDGSLSYPSHLHAQLQRGPSVDRCSSDREWQHTWFELLQKSKSVIQVIFVLRLYGQPTRWYLSKFKGGSKGSEIESKVIGAHCFVLRIEESLIPIIGSCKHCETLIASSLIWPNFYLRWDLCIFLHSY